MSKVIPGNGPMNMGHSAPTQLRILCFGASITAGFHMFGLAYHPYSRRLKTHLNLVLPNTNLDISVDALSGDVVLGGSYSRRIEAQTAPNKAQYDWIIVQGGGNDLLRGKEPQAIFEGLQEIWRKALSSGARVLALNVTETSSAGLKMRSNYNDLNAMIMNHTELGLFPLDLCKAIPYHNMDPDKRKKIWDDGLHFKKSGYDLMGDIVAQRLEEIMSEGRVSKL